jgi:hypothetical protein
MVAVGTSWCIEPFWPEEGGRLNLFEELRSGEVIFRLIHEGQQALGFFHGVKGQFPLAAMGSFVRGPLVLRLANKYKYPNCGMVGKGRGIRFQSGFALAMLFSFDLARACSITISLPCDLSDVQDRLVM